MSHSAPALDDPIDWQELFEAPDGRRFLPRLLQAISKSSGLRAAAAYGKAERGYTRLSQVGQVDFPARLEPDTDVGVERLEIPGGVLLYELVEGQSGRPGDFPAGLEGASLLALSVALRNAQLESRLKRQSFAAAYRGVELEALYDVGLAIASTLNLEQLSEEILLRAAALLDARRGALYLASDGSYRLEHTFGGDALAAARLDDPRIESLFDHRPAPRQGAEPRPAATEGLLPGARYLIGVPVEADGKRLGILLMGDKESRHGVGPFGDTDRRTLALFANQAAIALENAHLHRQALEKERLERELELAAEIQVRLLPTRLPEIVGLEMIGWSRQARHVGGDYYNLVERPDGGLVAVLADVSGKGMPAALLVSTVHSALQLLLDGGEFGPELIGRLNQHVVGSSLSNRFITLLAAEVSAERDTLRYVNAGHNPGLVLRPSGEVVELESNGFPLGLFPAPYGGGQVELAPDDLVCVYSDGITEAATPDEEEFGADRLIDLLRPLAGHPLGEIVHAVDEAVTRFAQGEPQGDDQTLVFLRRST